MYSMTRFSQLLKHFPKATFNKIVHSTGADRYVKKFKSWDLITLMIYGQVSQAKSLRTLIDGFSSHHNSHYHLNTHDIKRSTFSDALSSRKIEPFKLLCEQLMAQVSRSDRKQCKEMISIIDSTSIHIVGKGFEWTSANHCHRTHGMKLHVELRSDLDAPVYANITHANLNDITDAKANIQPKKGTTYLMDKGYIDFNWWYEMNQVGASFVSRTKSNTAMQVIEDLPVYDTDKTSIKSDQIIHLTNKYPGAKRKTNKYANKDLRLVSVYREGKIPLALITNDFERSAAQIAALYKQRWQIELFFKWIKQKLKLKTYFGRSENAVRIQIYCALISYLMMRFMQKNNRMWESALELQTWLQHGLFVRDSINSHYYQRFKEKQRLISQWQTRLMFA